MTRCPAHPWRASLVKATVTLDPESHRIVVDLRDNIDAMQCGLNVSEACARTAALIGVFNCLDPEIPKNFGSFSRVEVLIRDGSTIGGARHPVSFSVATTNLADRIVAAVQLALGQLHPETAVAEVGSVNPPHKGVVSGLDPRSGGPFINQLFLGSTGGPASAQGDGWLTYSHAGNAGLCFIDSIEMAEMHHPIRVLTRALKIDSEGAGQYCGAPSLEVELGPTHGAIELAYVSDGVHNPAQGVCCGGAGGGAAQSKRHADGRLEALPTIARITLNPGETVLSTGTGGGGYGDPRRRDRAKVLADVLDRTVSRGRAETHYGVVLSGDDVDPAATEHLRACPGEVESGSPTRTCSNTSRSFSQIE